MSSATSKAGFILRALLLLAFLPACGPAVSQTAAPETPTQTPPMVITHVHLDPMIQALAHAARTEDDVARDGQRHPAETVAFFNIESNDRVLELWAGSGWYSRVLAPYLSVGGHLTVTQYAEDAEPSYRGEHAQRWEAYRAEHNVELWTSTITITPDNPQLAIADSMDVVVTFRNVHNWVKADTDASIYAQSFAALKPGGIFGIVEHRAPGMTREQSAQTGYMDQQAVIDAVTAVGFVFEEASEINANPNDTHDHPEGVWTLPPTFALDDVDREKYTAIGESDRMTLRFRKPLE